MQKFLIVLEHEDEAVACARAVKILLDSGSHFLTNADYGCCDGVHKAWITIEAESKSDARSVLPPLFREQAKIVGLNKFSIEEIDELLRHHGDSS